MNTAQTRPQTIEDAARAQLDLYEKWERGEASPEETRNFRWANLKEGFEGPVPAPEYGIGMYTKNTETGEVCPFRGAWFLDGQVLLCLDCWEDGT